MGDQSTLHRTHIKGPSPHPSPGGRGRPVHSAEKGPCAHPGSLFPLPSGEGQGEGPQQNNNM